MTKNTTTTSNILMTAEANDAKTNLGIIIKTQRAMAESFIDGSIALHQIRALKQYKELGFGSMGAFLESQGIEISRSQANDMARLGLMLAFGIDATRDEMVRAGYSSMKELARLCQTADKARENGKLVARCISRRSNGTMSHTDVVDIVNRELKGSAAYSATPAEAPEAEATEAEATEPATKNTPAWRGYWQNRFNVISIVARNEAEFIALMSEALENYDANGDK